MSRRRNTFSAKNLAMIFRKRNPLLIWIHGMTKLSNKKLNQQQNNQVKAFQINNNKKNTDVNGANLKKGKF
jgi:hypothetical protein